jgi:hypothetical protein
MELQSDLLAELRERARRGEGPCSLAELIGRRLGEEGSSYRLLAILYFKEAFGLTIMEAKNIGAAPVFEPGGRSADDIAAEMMQILTKHRRAWDPGSGSDCPG